MLDIESKYIITADYNKFTEDIVANKELVDKPAIVEFISSADLDKRNSNISNKS